MLGRYFPGRMTALARAIARPLGDGEERLNARAFLIE